ncbi:hypothetical protein CEXT_185611 [Caerostris extrusa]|uniref:Uncharacterized protein n=1 Tax=Caerostris extrusa TaxID=172846 RepID=A0AAV4SEX5_CAEEX|nr:hypothetical protein CEXT_185611 [Caerostris extrusa]
MWQRKERPFLVSKRPLVVIQIQASVGRHRNARRSCLRVCELNAVALSESLAALTVADLYVDAGSKAAVHSCLANEELGRSGYFECYGRSELKMMNEEERVACDV